jgi:hypothetical protein
MHFNTITYQDLIEPKWPISVWTLHRILSPPKSKISCCSCSRLGGGRRRRSRRALPALAPPQALLRRQRLCHPHRKLQWLWATATLCPATILLPHLTIDRVAARRRVPPPLRSTHNHTHHKGNKPPPASRPVCGTMARDGGGVVAVSFDVATATEGRCKSRGLEGSNVGAERVAAALCEGHIHPSIPTEIPQKPIVLGEFKLHLSSITCRDSTKTNCTRWVQAPLEFY